MNTWLLYGGPRHEETGTGPAPDGYEFVSRGPELPSAYGLTPRGFDGVYRWHEDAAYIRDGLEVLRMYKDGELAVPAQYADIVNAIGALGMESLNVGIGLIADQPTSDEAQGARDSVDAFRQSGIV